MKPVVLVVFVDSLGPEQASLLLESGLSLPHVHQVRGVLGYSSGALPTILTGASPEVHGRMCLFSRAKTRSPLEPLRHLGLLPRVVHERAWLRRRVGNAFAKLREYDGYFAIHKIPPDIFPLLDTPEQDDLFSSRRIGTVETFLSRARDAGLSVLVSDWRRPEAERIELIEQAPAADLVFLYLSGLDGLLHRHGGPCPSVREWSQQAVRWIQSSQHKLAHQPGGQRDVCTLVVGDHGMSSVDHYLDPRPVVAQLRRKTKRFVFVDSTMLRVGVDGAQDEAEVRALLGELPGQLLDRNAMQKRSAPSDGSYGDLIALLPEGSIFAPSFVGGRVKGMHGYDISSSSARAAVLSDSPLAANLQRLEDVAPWVLDRLGLKH